MLPLPAAVALSQVVALAAVEATGYIVMATASLIKDIDFRLMYEQDVLQKAGYFKRFITTKTKKNAVLALSVISLVVYFLPTLVSIQNSAIGREYTYWKITEGKPRLIYASPANVVFKELINTKKQGELNTTTAILENFLVTANKSTTANPSGLWHNVRKQIVNTKISEYNPQYPPVSQTINAQEGNFVVADDKKTVTYYFSKRQESSSTLKHCIHSNDPAYSNNLVSNFSNIEGHRVQAVRAYNYTCYPTTDDTLSLRQAVFKEPNSVLDSNDEIIRSSFLHEQVSASVSADASLLYLDDDRISMLIKRKAHITVFYDDVNDVLCRAPTNIVNSTLPYRQDIDSIVCQLTELAALSPNLPMFQATRRTIENNKIVNSVYTYIRRSEGGHGIMVDLVSISPFSIKLGLAAGFAYSSEVLLAHQVIKQQGLHLTSNYNRLLQEIDPFPSVDTSYGQNTWTDLVLAATGLFKISRDGNYFTTTTAVVIPTLAMPSDWLIIVCVLFVVFSIIVVIASMVSSRIYKTDLRKLLLSTLQYSLKKKTENALVAPDGAIEMNDRSRSQIIIQEPDGKMDELYASVLKYGEENKERNQLLTMDDVPIIFYRNSEGRP